MCGAVRNRGSLDLVHHEERRFPRRDSTNDVTTGEAGTLSLMSSSPPWSTAM